MVLVFYSFNKYLLITSYANFIEDILKKNTYTLFFMDLNHIKKIYIKEIFGRTTTEQSLLLRSKSN